MSQKGQVDVPTLANVPAGIQPVESGSMSRDSSERRLLTVLCYDLVGSTGLLAQADMEDVHELTFAFQKGARQAVTARGGIVRDELGDGGIALFPAGVAAKDAASMAIHAALEIIDTCRRVGSEKGHADLHVRVGIATSMVIFQGSEDNPNPANATGVALVLATRLQALAEPDTVLVSHQTRSLARRSHTFRFQGVRDIKGFAEPERVWRALGRNLKVDRFFAFGRLGISMVNREAELKSIVEYWRAAVAGKGEVVLIEGEAGIGKSRFLHEIRAITRQERKKMLLFQCVPGGSRSTLHPLLQRLPKAERGGRLTAGIVAKLFEDQGIRDPDVIDVFSFLLGAEGANDQAFKDADPDIIRGRADQAARRSLEYLCAGGPVILAVEDLHWIDPTSQHLLMGIARSIHQYPVLLIITTRPGVDEEWRQIPNLRSIVLNRFGPDDTRMAIAAMWPEDRPDASPEMLDVVDRITGGVPLFIEEICQWMAENASHATDQLTKTASPGSVAILENVLDARLDPLGPAKQVARAAAVAGNRFDFPLLREILPDMDEDVIRDALDGLNEAGFLLRTRSSGAAFYVFRHALIQETIYNALLRKTRQSLHGRLFAVVSRNRDIAPWIETAALADHAERAGLIEDAIPLLVAAGKERSSHSAMAEARHLLEHALELCEQIGEAGKQDTMKLSAFAALGPVLTSTEGSGSPRARRLYEDGVEIARRRPIGERAMWFPIYWGWWYTDPEIDKKRAQAILDDLRDVEDAEVQLQIRHCVWAIDLNLGRHESCIAAVDAGMALYEAGRARENFTLFGGHDAKVCGLALGSHSLWFAGRAASAMRSLSEARAWAHQIGHIASIAHVYDVEAKLHCSRRDFHSLRAVIADMRSLTEKQSLPSLVAEAQIFLGWCEGNAGHWKAGRDMTQQALAALGQIETPEDYPVYKGMLAELMARTGEIAAALELVSSAATEAERMGHRYWLSELYHRHARLLIEQDADNETIVAALTKSLDIASEQNAVPLLLNAYDTLLSSGISPELVPRYRNRVELAMASVEPGVPLIVNLEPPPQRRPAAGVI